MKSPKNPLNLWMCSWNKLAPKNVIPFAFTLTSSDAINLLPSIIVMVKRLNNHNDNYNQDILKHPQILYLDSSYGAARGPLAGMNFIEEYKKFGLEMSNLAIPSPHYWKSQLDDGESWTQEEIRMLEKKEELAIKTIKSKRKKNPCIGGVFFEPIVGPAGIFFYRHDFVMKLRSICNELNYYFSLMRLLLWEGLENSLDMNITEVLNQTLLSLARVWDFLDWPVVDNIPNISMLRYGIALQCKQMPLCF